MNPYSHFVVATKLEGQVKPENSAEYYWGAVAPDVRYPAGIKRDRTHLPAWRITHFMARYPHLKSFLQGYLVHCLADEIELGDIFFQYPPFFLLQGWMSRQRMAMSLELYYFEFEKEPRQVSGGYNKVLNKLGISQEASTRFAQSINHYFCESTPETRFVNLFQMLGLENDYRLEKYRSAARNFQNNHWLRKSLFYAIRAGRISERIVQTLRVSLSEIDLPNPASPG